MKNYSIEDLKNFFDIAKNDITEENRKKYEETIKNEALLSYQINILKDKYDNILPIIDSHCKDLKIYVDLKQKKELQNKFCILNTLELFNPEASIRPVYYIQNKTFALVYNVVSNGIQKHSHIHFRLNTINFLGTSFVDLNNVKLDILHFYYNDEAEDYDKNIEIIKNYFIKNYFNEIKPKIPETLCIKRKNIDIRTLNFINKDIFNEYEFVNNELIREKIKLDLLNEGFPENKLNIKL